MPIVTYVNTSAAVKAELDICCTSGNAKAVVEFARRSARHHAARRIPRPQHRGADRRSKIITWSGHCEVHERFTAAEVRELREDYPGVAVLAHPECPPEVVAEADFSGSTAAMQAYVGRHRPARLVLLTECSMSDNVAVQYPELEFVRPCNLCPHMKKISLGNIRRALETMQHEVKIDPKLAAPARRAVERMLAVK